MTVSKTKTSFYRRLYVAWLIDSGTACSVPALMEATGMPRRTAQDTLAALADRGLVMDFWEAETANIPHLKALALEFPSLTIVLDHLGGMVGCMDTFV